MTAAVGIPSKKAIRFIHDIEPELIDYLCKVHDVVIVKFEAYDYEDVIQIPIDPNVKNGVIRKHVVEMAQKAGMSSTIKSSKDVVQFDTDDMKVLTTKTRKELR